MSKETIYSEEEALKASTEYFQGDELAAKVFIDKYALRNNEQQLVEKTPDDMHWRIAHEFARIEKKKFKNPFTAEQIFQFIKHFERIIPQGSPMYGIGNPYQVVSLSNCYVAESPLDSYGGILHTDHQIAQVSKRRGGVGIDISHLRPNGTPTHNAARSSTGILPFLERFSNTIREVGQSGRRGALMVTISVHHPEVVEFAKIKRDLKKVTGANISIRFSDEFLKAVEKDQDYEQRWPVDASSAETLRQPYPVVSNKVSARKIWREIVENAHLMAEPGILFWDNITRFSPADSYADIGFKTVSTNPCLTKETKVYVADGRGSVSIGQLAEEAKDVDVFCLNNNGDVSIRKMRNPRCTEKKIPVFKVTLEDEFSLKATANHEFRMKDGSFKKVSDLKIGDSLDILARYKSPIVKEKEKEKSKNDYYWVSHGWAKTQLEHRILASHYFGDVPKNHVVHHKDYNTENNSINNLEVLSSDNHNFLHRSKMLGKNNPMVRAKEEWSSEKWIQYKEKMSKSVSEEKNGRYCGCTNEELFNHALLLTNKIGRRFSKKDWLTYASENNLPKGFSQWRKKYLGNIVSMSKRAAEVCRLENTNTDPRVIKSFQKAILEGYSTIIENNEVVVLKKCEWCNSEFKVFYYNREVSFCCRTCSNNYKNKFTDTNVKRTKSINATYSKKMSNIKEKQLKIFSDLKFQLKRLPQLNEWENACKGKVSYRLRTKYGFESYGKIIEESENYNHKIVSVEFAGYEDVYNGTVEEFHNFFVGGFDSKTKNSKEKLIFINSKNCGELPLSIGDSCRLTCLNLYSYVRNPFEKKAYFDASAFFDDVIIGQRFMDNLVDLEIEAIGKIIDKVKSDPEPSSIRDPELAWWKQVKDACSRGRRTGTGITALGDMLAALGIKYGSKQSIDMVDRVYKIMKFGSYYSSIEMAKELGAFPVWDWAKEKNNEFLAKFKDDEVDLGNDRIIKGNSILSEMKKHGRRNIACNTTAPTGSVSLLTQTTSGIEPVFMLSFTRRKKVNPNDKNVRIDFVDPSGDSWQEYKIYHSKVLEWMKATGLAANTTGNAAPCNDACLKESPWYGATSEDIDWVNRVKMQAAAQNHVDHSISSTVNLPEDVSVEKVQEIYETAWKAGCKGITIYRKNCRTGVLIEKKDEERASEEFVTHNAPKRPIKLPCDVYRFKCKGRHYTVFIGLLKGKPYEVFAMEGDEQPKENTGITKKENRGHYRMLSLNGDVLVENINKVIAPEEAAITRFISTSLRHGADVAFVVHQCEKIDGGIGGFTSCIGRALKKYVKDGTKVTGDQCGNCKGTNIIRNQGCVTCADCGWSKC